MSEIDEIRARRLERQAENARRNLYASSQDNDIDALLAANAALEAEVRELTVERDSERKENAELGDDLVRVMQERNTLAAQVCAALAIPQGYEAGTGYCSKCGQVKDALCGVAVLAALAQATAGGGLSAEAIHDLKHALAPTVKYGPRSPKPVTAPAGEGRLCPFTHGGLPASDCELVAKQTQGQTVEGKIRDYCLECCGEVGPDCDGAQHRDDEGRIDEWCRIYNALKAPAGVGEKPECFGTTVTAQFVLDACGPCAFKVACVRCRWNPSDPCLVR